MECNFYRVDYEGLWLGGTAIVFAEDESGAIELVRKDPRTCRYMNITVTQILAPGPVVLYNDNGDY